MLELFNTVDGEYTLPDGSKVTSLDLKNDKQYASMFSGPCVIKIIDGVLYSYQPLYQMAETYGIPYDESDPSEVLSAVIDKIKYAKKNPPIKFDVSDVVYKAASFAALSFTDEQALEVPDLYPVYEVDHAYKKDERFTYNGHLFKVNQDHTSAAQWVPGETGTESLYTNLEMAGDGYLVWTQPTGAHNAYNTGDIVHYPTEDDPLYKSLIDGNVWSPDAYPQGWESYNEE